MNHRLVAALVLCLAVVALLGVGAAPAVAADGNSLGAQLAIQQAELASPDVAENALFGWAVAISGNSAVVGTVGHSVGGNAFQGAAYVFVRNGTTWNQQAELTVADGTAIDMLGCDVAISGNTAIVGACNHPTVGDNPGPGAVYVFVRRGTTWTQQAKLTAADGAAGDGFGYTVAISGNTMVVGADARTVGDNAEQGVVYIFVRSGTTWTQQAELAAADGAAGDLLGNDVAISGNTVVAATVGHTVGDNTGQGAAYVFVRHGTTWSQQAELTAADGAAYDWFGWAVAISGNTAVVGAIGRTMGEDGWWQGAAYVFVRRGTTWTQQAELMPADGAAFDEVGSAVAVAGNTAVIGAVGRSDGQGAAYVFVRSGTTWSQQAELTAADGAASDNLGNQQGVAISGNRAVVGAPGHMVDGNAYVGAAYVYSGIR